MNRGCAEFRAALAEHGARGQARAADRLAHARDCLECGALLRRELELEALLDVVRDEPAQVSFAGRQLAARVLSRLAPERATNPGLGALLDSVAVPAAPPGLAERVLAGLAPARTASRAPRHARRRVRLLAGVAAAALAGLAIWGWRLRSRAVDPAPAVVEGVAPKGLSLEHDEELIAYALERWELLHDDDVDLWFASLDPEEELLMELSAGDALRDLEESRSAQPR